MGNHEGKPEKTNHEKTQELVNAVGAIAEMSLVFYRAALGAGADATEAVKLTQAYLATILSSSGKGQEETS